MHEKKPLVSIIVPAYNAEKYIEKCIDSVLAQSYTNIELIVVNDGSNDRTQEICNSYVEKDVRVHIIHKENAGVSAARNSGISAANGSLICFLDADDWLSPNIIQLGVDGFRSDCINVWGATEFLPNGMTKHDCIVAQGLTREELIANVIYIVPDDRYELGTYFRAVWGKLFEKSIIDDYAISFQENLHIGEDAVFLVNYLTHIFGVHVVAEDGYNYNRMNEGSATTKYQDKLYEQCKIQYEDIIKVITDNSMDKIGIIADSLVNFRWWTVTALIDNAVKGRLSKKLPIQDLTTQAMQWIKDYEIEMKEKMISSSNIGKRHQSLYDHREKINSAALIKHYLLPQAVKKILKNVTKRGS